jgi:hypothetical protein
MKTTKKKKSATVTRVVFYHPPHNDGNTVFYFGSLAAIYDSFTVDEIGCNLSTLWKARICPGNMHIGRKCVISKEFLQRKNNHGCI